MSIDERHLAIGKAVEQYGENKRHLAALVHRARELGGYLSTVADFFLHFGERPTNALAANQALNNLSSLDKVKELMQDIDNATADRQRLGSILRDAGVDPKD